MAARHGAAVCVGFGAGYSSVENWEFQRGGQGPMAVGPLCGIQRDCAVSRVAERGSFSLRLQQRRDGVECPASAGPADVPNV